MSRYRLTLMYDGAAYAGWQVQPNGIAVQQVLEETMSGIVGQLVRVHASGRTDAGVHAVGQVVHFDSDWDRVLTKLQLGLNARLPPSIRIVDIASVADDFHAQYDAVSKEYRYCVWNGRVVPPFVEAYRYRVNQAMDEQAMQAAADRLIGEHDFASFSANPHDEREGTVRRILEAQVQRDGAELTLRFVGNGFLYKMVRSLSGFLVDVGRGRYEPEMVTELLARARRECDVITAPAHGLFLWKVTYPGD